MRKRSSFLVVLVVFVLCFGLVSVFGGNMEGEEKLSPYFFVEGDPEVDSFPLLKTDVSVNIVGTIAEVELTQVYKNDGKKTLEAIYVFPLGTKSAIHAMRMKIGKRIIDAEIHKTAEAREIYEQAKEDGKTASLLEQKRPNVFQMNVANIMPGDKVEVIVKYTEHIVPEEGIYKFVYPTVVGPRFTGESKKSDLKDKDNWAVTPYTKEGIEPSMEFDIKADIRTGLPLQRVKVNSHKVDIDKKGKDRAIVNLSPSEKKGGNRDFILEYSLRGNEIESGLLLYPGEKENFFLLMMEPPKNVDRKMLPGREYIFVVDVSGSMHGFPLDVSKELMFNLLDDLDSNDYFNIVFFSGGSKTLSNRPLKATRSNIKKAKAMMKEMRGGGGTRILNALKTVYKLKKKRGMSRSVVIVTDGYISVEKECFDYIRENLNEANVFSFGIGRSVNRYLIEGLARIGEGEPYIITNKKTAKKTAKKFMEYIRYPLLTDIEVKFNGFKVYDVEPPAVPDLFAERPLVIYGKYKNAKGNIIITGETGSGKFKKLINVSTTLANKDNLALKYLWAREKIARLDDYSKVRAEVKDEVTELGLKYGLMTAYTSFVAVDKVIRDTGEIVKVKQPLPLPSGVSNYAVDEGNTYGGSYKMSSVRTKPGGLFRKPAMTSAPSPKPVSEEEVSRDKDSLFDAEYGKVISISRTYQKGPAKNIEVEFKKHSRNLSVSYIEKNIIDKVDYAQLDKLFTEWSLKNVTVQLFFKNGKLKDFKVPNRNSMKFSESDLEKVFSKLNLSSKYTGMVELELSR